MGHNLLKSHISERRRILRRSRSCVGTISFYTTGSNVYDFLTEYWVGIPICVEDCILSFGESYATPAKGLTTPPASFRPTL
jgi:hypothetical protein